MELEDFFREYPKVAVAFSGGCDSAFLLYAAKKYAREVQAYYVKSLFQPRFELEDARKLAKELGVDMKEIPLDVLEDALVAGNPQNRCYYCKKYIFSTIVKAAAEDGFTILLDGTNASDEEDESPIEHPGKRPIPVIHQPVILQGVLLVFGHGGLLC